MSIFDKQSPINPLTPGGTHINSLHTIKNFQKEWLDVPKKTPYLERAPLDQSAYGFLDPALRLLPPAMRREVEKAAKVGPYIAVKMATSALIKLANSTKSDVIYYPGKYPGGGITTGGITRGGGLAEKARELLEKFGISASGEGTGILALNPSINKPRKELIFYNDLDLGTDEYANDLLDVSGYNPNDFQSNDIVQRDLDNVHNFIPRQKMFWTIKLTPYKGDDGTVIPDLGSFSSKYDSRKINYRDWLPAMNYTYDRKSMTALDHSYGWGQSFSQMNAPSRGKSFSMDLMDDRDHNISNYLNHVGNLSAEYEGASLTYWKLLCHVIEVSTYNYQWELTARFKLLGIVQNLGITNYSSDDDNFVIKCIFSVVGELNDNTVKEEKFK